MLKMIFQSFQEDNNVINVAANKKFMRSKNHVHHALNIQKRFLIIHESYISNFEIIITDNYELFIIFYSHSLLIEKISFIHHTDIFTTQNQHDNV